MVSEGDSSFDDGVRFGPGMPCTADGQLAGPNGGLTMPTAKKAASKSRSARNFPRSEPVVGDEGVLAKIDEMPEPDRAMGRRLHALIRANAPGLTPRLWYGMPAYAQGPDVVCFFRSRAKFQERYMTLGFNDSAHLDDGHVWATQFALVELTAADEARIVSAIRKAVG